MATNDIWDGTTQIDRILSSSSRLSSHRQTDVFPEQLRVSLVPYWHYTWLLKRGETKQKCASAKTGKEDGRTPAGLKQVRMSGSVVLSLLCLWPYGNSLIVCCDSEFYQCHTQNRRRYDWSQRTVSNTEPPVTSCKTPADLCKGRGATQEWE